MRALTAIANDVSSWASITPPPASTAIQAVASLVKVTAILVEGHQLARKQRKWVEDMAKKASNVAEMIHVHAVELRNNSTFGANVEAVTDIANRLRGFAQKRQESFSLTRAFRAAEDQSTLSDYEQQLDRVVTKFTADLVHLTSSSGPHQLINHMDLRRFWKYRLCNPHEIRWELFWDHFFHEHPGIANVYFSNNLTASKAQIEKRSRTHGVVTPYDIRHIFKDPTRSIAWHIQDALGLEQRPISSSSHQISQASRVYQWKGRMDGDIVAELNLEMELDKQNNIKFSKLYNSENITIVFEGIVIDGNEINGTWTKRPLTLPSNIIPNGRGQFMLTEAQTISNSQQVYEMQNWKGQYDIMNSDAISISAKVLFLRYERQVQGSGQDEHGHFFCQGFLFPEHGNIEASILVRYKAHIPTNRPDILFKGILVGDRGKSRMEGECFCPPEAIEGCGTFMLELTETHINLP